MIRVGEYIRTKEGYIAKCIGISESEELYEFNRRINNEGEWELFKGEFSDISKHSSNIKDLIEIGDLVNNRKITEDYEIYDDDLGGYFNVETHDFKIESIVTHEILNKMMYRVEEEV